MKNCNFDSNLYNGAVALRGILDGWKGKQGFAQSKQGTRSC